MWRGRTHLQNASPANRTVVRPFRLSGPAFLAPLIWGIEVTRHGRHEGFCQASFFVVILGVIWGRDWAGIADEAHNE